MPAIPMAESKPPMVVGIRHTSREMRTKMVCGAPELIAKGCRVTTASIKMIVSPASRMLSAISFGVFCRSAPSTSAIIRSMKVSPGFEVMRILIWSESTRVPPVTAERSPPASRITGADSPVIADSSTEATPSTISPSPGMNSPAETITRSSLRSCGAWTSSVLLPLMTRWAIVSVLDLRRLSACALPRPSAIASAKFANNTVNQSQSVICNSNPLFVTPGMGAISPRISCSVVKTLPTSTTNMTGLPIILRGFSFLNELVTARLTICVFQIAFFFVWPLILFLHSSLALDFGLWSLVFGLSSLRSVRRVTRVQIANKDQSPKTQDRLSKRFPCIHQQVLNNWSQAQYREKCQSSNNQNHTYQQCGEQWRGNRKSSERRRHCFLSCQATGNGQCGNDHQKATYQHRDADRGVVPKRVGIQPGKC